MRGLGPRLFGVDHDEAVFDLDPVDFFLVMGAPDTIVENNFFADEIRTGGKLLPLVFNWLQVHSISFLWERFLRVDYTVGVTLGRGGSKTKISEFCNTI